VISSIQDFIRTHSLGPDALLISLDQFINVLHTTRAPIKAALMNQTKLAGIGNIYADEILFQSKVDPHSLVSELSEESMKSVFNNMNYVLRLAIELRAKRDKFPKNFLTQHRKKNEHCPSCGGILTTGKIDGRTTYFCPVCQN
jgi:formamidopyrimidine-DNA glycosylase